VPLKGCQPSCSAVTEQSGLEPQAYAAGNWNPMEEPPGEAPSGSVKASVYEIVPGTAVQVNTSGRPATPPCGGDTGEALHVPPPTLKSWGRLETSHSGKRV
jgi:hypothetical protein